MPPTRIVTIDGAGRVVVPKDLRDALGMIPGFAIGITVRGSHLELASLPRAVRLERRGAITVAAPVEPSAPLPTQEVEGTRKALRERDRAGWPVQCGVGGRD